MSGNLMLTLAASLPASHPRESGEANYSILVKTKSHCLPSRIPYSVSRIPFLNSPPLSTSIYPKDSETRSH